MAQKVKIDGLAEAVMKDLTEYADLATVDMKAAVKKAGNTVKKQIQSTAPKDTGAYGKSWSVKNTKETSKSLEVTVYSRNRYQLAHLLEFGHAKRLFPGSDNFSADGRVYYKINEVNIELYCDSKDPALEATLEAVLDEHGIFYNKTEVWIESEKLYEVLYTFEMEV